MFSTGSPSLDDDTTSSIDSIDNLRSLAIIAPMAELPQHDRGLPALRVRKANSAPERQDGEFVLYWMIAFRRTSWNWALDHAIDAAQRLGRPLLIFEALTHDYAWASARLHTFILQGMRENRAACHAAGVTYYPYVEPKHLAGRGLFEALASRAALVVTDEFPSFFLPSMVARLSARVPVRVDAVDSNGLLPLALAPRAFLRAVDFRRFLQTTLAPHLGFAPAARPLVKLRDAPKALVPPDLQRRWASAEEGFLLDTPDISGLGLDDDVGPVPTRGGTAAARKTLRSFLATKLAMYGESRNHPDQDTSSGLSPYLHFGHISSHEILRGLVLDFKDWKPGRQGGVRGSKEGWWGLPPSHEAFLDQFVTWRELGFNFCHHRQDADRYESLPDWAKTTLDAHRHDRRPHLYDLETFEAAATHDPIWNAAQTQLRKEGTIHNYLRMLWGKKIFEWSPGPEEALAVMIELNNRWALDGRNPNSYSGIFWVLGRYDRPFGLKRAIYGNIRFMSSENTKRKLRMKDYLDRYTPGLFS